MTFDTVNSGHPTDWRTLRVHPVRLVSPAVLLGIAGFLAIAPAMFASDEQKSRWGAAWRLTEGSYWAMGLGLSAIAFGMLLGRRRVLPIETRVYMPDLARAARWLTTLYFVGLAVWMVLLVTNGLTLGLALGAIRGDAGATFEVKALNTTLPGVSTLTEVGPVLAAVLMLLRKLGDRRKSLFLVVAISVIRSLVVGERVALITVLLPVLIVWALVDQVGDRHRLSARARRWWITAGAVGAPALFITYFGLAERSRSWNYYSSRYDGSLWGFAVDRIWAYYATAANNGVIYADYQVPAQSGPLVSLEALASFPPTAVVMNSFGWLEQDRTWPATLALVANPEFNNPSTFLPISAELGVPLALAMFCCWGIVIGRSYSNALRGSVVGLAAYAVLAVALLELPRFSFLTSGRAIAAVLGLVVLKSLLKMRQPPFSQEAGDVDSVGAKRDRFGGARA